MRRTPWQRTNSRSSRGFLWSGVVLGLALLFAFARFVAPELTLAVSAPAFMFGNALSGQAGGFFASFADARALAREVESLKEENSALALENRTLAERLSDITKLLGTTTPPASGIVAGVVARPPTAPYDTLIIAVGSGAGVAPGMSAFGAGGVPLGVVTEAEGAYARVTLLSASGMSTDAWVGAARVPVTLKGKGAGAFTASVSQGTGIVAGDLVYAAGPGAIPVGRVIRVAELSSDPAVTLAIAPVINPFRITWVVLRDAGGEFLRSSAGTAENEPASPEFKRGGP